MKLLFLDIETAPHKVYSWGLYDQNIQLNNIVEPGYTLCFSAKWEKSKKIFYHDIRHGKKEMLQEAWNLLDEADAVCHYNGANFDIPILRGEFMFAHMPPPSPFVQLDLLKTMRTTKIVSRKLDYVCEQLGLGNKFKHKGMELWHGCMNGEAASWNIMKKYNQKDVHLLESLFHEIRPWISGLPYDPDECQHLHAQPRGTYPTKQRLYQRLYCPDCKTWLRSNLIISKTKLTTLKT